MNNYPFTRCLHPKYVFNRYTCESLVVSCGYCKACLLAKSSKYTLQCRLESLMHSRTYFVTLTYSDRYIPRACYSDGYLYDVDTGELLSDYSNYDDDYINRITLKLQNRYIPYLNKVDIQLFLKRLRKHYERENIKLRFFAVGEYGPKHFRPHYHLLLWVDSEKVLSDLQEVVRQKWSFGRTDCQISEGDCARYVTGYANSFGFVPSILRQTRFAPFCIHSKKLGLGYIFKSCQEVYETPFANFMERSFNYDGVDKVFRLWRQAYLAYFPRCVGFACKSSYQRLQSYSIYTKVNLCFSSDCSLYCVSCIIWDKIVKGIHNIHDKNMYDLCAYFFGIFPNNGFSVNIDVHDEDLYDFYVNRIYRELLISRQFCLLRNQLSPTLTMSAEEYLLSKIESFYSDYDYSNLVNNLSSQELYFDDTNTDDIDFVYYPSLEVSFFDSISGYNSFAECIEKRYNDSIKHKKQNDINNLLNY